MVATPSARSATMVAPGSSIQRLPDTATSNDSGIEQPRATPESTAIDRGPTVADTSAARSPHHLTVVTPEGVVLEFRAAGVGSRTLAKMIDLVIQFVALFLALIVLGLVAFVNEVVAAIFIVVAIFLVIYGYSAIQETWWGGRTVGKRVFRLKVITTEGGPVRFRHAAIRSIIATFDFFVPTPGGLVAVFFALLTKRSQRLGDIAAGTIVIREPRGAQAPVFFPPAFSAEAFSDNLDTSRLDAKQYTLVREFLIRANELTIDARNDLSHQLARRVSVSTGNPIPPGLDAERFLVAVLNAHQGRFAASAYGLAPPVPAPRSSRPPIAPPPDPTTRMV